MIYTGEIRDGVIVLKNAPHLEEGTSVRVEIDSADPEVPIGSAEALVKHAGGWAHIAKDVDEALEDLRQSKQAELKVQMARVEDQL